ncbi:MAG: helix-turn-helix transcriptional regulator [Candidatus Poribacteria bacterium]|nr:helix-turn-helix transcriptional regulator [Candidatus Poribacteria bacterium]
MKSSSILTTPQLPHHPCCGCLDCIEVIDYSIAEYQRAYAHWSAQAKGWDYPRLMNIAAESQSLYSPVFQALSKELDRRNTPDYENLPSQSFCERVRTRLDLTQDQLAKEVGVSLSTIKSVETGRRLLSKEKAWQLVRFAKSKGYKWHRSREAPNWDLHWDLHLKADVPVGDELWRSSVGEHTPYGDYPQGGS